MEMTAEALWLEKYGHCLEREAPVEFEGKSFVLAGVKYLEEATGVPIAAEIVARGGVIRTDVSGRTDYLVVNPERAYESKLRAALVQRAKGRNVRVLLGGDLVKLLTGGEVLTAPVSDEDAPQAPAEPEQPSDTPAEQNAAQERLEALKAQCAEQEAIIAANKGWFGEQAKRRKAAQAKLEELRQTISREFPA